MTSIDEEDTVTTYLNIVSVTILLLFAKCSKVSGWGVYCYVFLLLCVAPSASCFVLLHVPLARG